MKQIREYRTKNGCFYCDVTILPDVSDDSDTWENLNIPFLRGTQCHLRLSFMIQYPEHVVPDMVCSRLQVLSHPNVSPLLVLDEVNHFISIVSKLFE